MFLSVYLLVGPPYFKNILFNSSVECELKTTLTTSKLKNQILSVLIL